MRELEPFQSSPRCPACATKFVYKTPWRQPDLPNPDKKPLIRPRYRRNSIDEDGPHLLFKCPICRRRWRTSQAPPTKRVSSDSLAAWVEQTKTPPGSFGPSTMGDGSKQDEVLKKPLKCRGCDDVGYKIAPGGEVLPCPDCELGQRERTMIGEPEPTPAAPEIVIPAAPTILPSNPLPFVPAPPDSESLKRVG